jgi:hypothetical protein
MPALSTATRSRWCCSAPLGVRWPLRPELSEGVMLGGQTRPCGVALSTQRRAHNGLHTCWALRDVGSCWVFWGIWSGAGAQSAWNFFTPNDGVAHDGSRMQSPPSPFMSQPALASL